MCQEISCIFPKRAITILSWRDTLPSNCPYTGCPMASNETSSSANACDFDSSSSEGFFPCMIV